MAVSRWQLNRFEKVLFNVAVSLGAALVVIRVASVAIIWYVHHIR